MEVLPTLEIATLTLLPPLRLNLRTKEEAMRSALASLIFVAICGGPGLCQSSTNGKASTTGLCSVAHSGNRDSIVINCGIDPEQGQKIIALLNKLVANPDNVSINNKLDEILRILSRQSDVTSQAAVKPADPQVIASPQTTRRTGNPRMPWETSFTITSNALVKTGDLRLKCNGPVIRAGISRINPASFISGSNGPDPKDANTVVYELGPEMLSPGQVVTIAVYSKEPVSVVSGQIGPQAIIF
jgi:hypothetical protein